MAGMFAFVSVEQASTTHTSGNQANIVALSANMLGGAAAATDAVATWSVNQPYCIVAASVTSTVNDGGDLDLDAVTIQTNMHSIGDSTLLVPGVIGLNTPEPLLPKTDANSNLICGSSGDIVLDITGVVEGFNANDAVTADILIQTQSDVGTVNPVLSDT